MVLSRIGTFLPKRGKVTPWSKTIGFKRCEKLTTVVITIRRDCFCNYQFNVKACSVQGIFKTADVVKNDPSSLECDAETVDVMS